MERINSDIVALPEKGSFSRGKHRTKSDRYRIFVIIEPLAVLWLGRTFLARSNSLPY